MKKILSILLALSVACGSIMLTACNEDEKDDDDDKSVSDKADKDDEDEDEDDEKSDDEDESSEEESEEESEESKEESEEESEESKEESEEESEESKEESEEESEEESDDVIDDGNDDDYESESEFVPSFADYTVTAYGEDYTWPIKAEPFLEYFELDATETLEADDWDWFYVGDTYTELDIFNPSAEEATAYADCYIDYLYWTVDDADFDVTVNGVGIGSTLDDINEAFSLEFTLEDGEICVWDDEYWGNEVNFFLEDGAVVEMEICSDDEYFFSDDEVIDDGGDVDEEAAYAAGDVVEFGGVTFAVPEGFEGYESSDDTIDFEAIDDMTFTTINIQATEADDASNYSQEFFDETYSYLADSFTPGEFITSTLGDADTIKYSATMDVSGIEMTIIQYCIFMEDSSVIVSIGLYGDENLDQMESFIDSIEVL